MLFYETYSHEHPSPHDDVCTISRNLAAHLFCNTHPHVARNKHQSRNVSWKKNFQTNWHIHAAIFEQSLRKIMEMNNVDISVDDSDLAFCIREHREYFFGKDEEDEGVVEKPKKSRGTRKEVTLVLEPETMEVAGRKEVD